MKKQLYNFNLAAEAEEIKDTCQQCNVPVPRHEEFIIVYFTLEGYRDLCPKCAYEGGYRSADTLYYRYISWKVQNET